MADEDEPKLVYADAVKARRRANLERARKTRERNAIVRRLLKERQVDAQRLIAGTLNREDETLRRVQNAADAWKIPAVLKAVPGIGPAKEHAVMASMQVSPNMKLGELRRERREQMARLVGVALAKGD